jgi:hypothetical protein
MRQVINKQTYQTIEYQNKPLQSITYNILKYAMKLNGKSKKLSGLNSDEIDIIEDNE